MVNAYVINLNPPFKFGYNNVGQWFH